MPRRRPVNRSAAPTDAPTSRGSPGYVAKVELRPVAELKVNPRNARTHSRKQLGQIMRSIKTFGFNNPIAIDEDGMVLAGHGRLEAARQLGMVSVPTIVLSHLSEAEKRAYVLADNKLADNAGWDRELLAIELGELAELLPQLDVDLDISITGFATPELDALFGDHADDQRDPADKVDLTVRPVVTRHGDLWKMGRSQHQIYCGDAVLPSTWERLAGSGAMTITDPPFNVRVNGHVGGRGRTRHKEFPMASGEMSEEEYRAFLAAWIMQIVAACTPGALIYIFIDWRHVEDVLAVCRSLLLELRNICIWNKTSPGQGSFYRSAHEMIVVFQVPGGEAINNIQLGRFGRSRTNVWTYPGVNTFKVGENDDYSLHPTVKPVAMIAEAIKDASPRGGIILDPFLGSGTTLLACEKVGRRCHGIEYEPSYVDVAIRRWQQFTGQDAFLVGQSDGASPDLAGLTFDEVAMRRAAIADAGPVDPTRLPDDHDEGADRA